jgi:predicted phosphodiesterase
MKIQLGSDLHLEFLSSWLPGERLLSPAPDADVLVLAGDIASGLDAIRLFGRWPVPVLYVMGNHEAYGWDLDELRASLRQAAIGTSIVFLDNEVTDLSQFERPMLAAVAPVRFLGSTLWTDYRLPGAGRSQREQMVHAGARIVDHRQISQGGQPFTPEMALAEHERAKAWLSTELARPFDGKTIVITHHAPHWDSVHPSYKGDPLNGAFISHLPDLVEQADVWMHGHTHNSFDYTAVGCRVVANPAGYPQNRSRATSISELVLENSEFKSMSVVEI